jgi:hypothetical protein
VERKLTVLALKMAKMGADGSNALVCKNKLRSILFAVGKKYRLENLSEPFLNQLIDNNLATVAPGQMLLVRYLNTLRYLESSPLAIFDKAAGYKIYSLLTNGEEKESLYRMEELEDITRYQGMASNHTYFAAPVATIAELMDNLYSFIARSDFSLLLKAIIASFFINYVKPFDSYLEEMSSLFFKAVLSMDGAYSFDVFLPLESLLATSIDSLNEVVIETQKTADLTYYVTFILDPLEKEIDRFLIELNDANAMAIKKEYYTPDVPAPLTPLDEAVMKPSTVAKVETVINNTNPAPSLEEIKNVALPVMSTGYSEDEAKKIEQHLLELNPKLKKHEAYFYARHCTVEKYYTIAQFKKEVACSYETARTSMDNLVYLGYYFKEMVKNKFVYSPVIKK